jgi:uncharacterized membrane protein (DUF441 family)
MNFIAGVIVGITVATIGVSGVAHLIDQGVVQTQSVVRSVAK